MKHPVTQELHAYWDRLRGARLAPERSDIDPGAIRSILADTFVLEVNGGVGRERDYPVRLSGTRVNALGLEDLKGRSLVTMFRDVDRDALLDALDAVVDDQVPIVAGVRAQLDGRAPADLELLLLPLRHNGRTHSRVLGSFAFWTLPSWLGLLPAEDLSLLSFRTLSQSHRAPTGIMGAAVMQARRGRFIVHQGGR